MPAGNAAGQASDRRTQRRIAVGLPMLIRGTDRQGMHFEDTCHSYDVSRNGASFSSTRELELGMEVEIVIPRQNPNRPTDNDFITQARVVRVLPGEKTGESLIGVQFVGPRFHRVYVSESTA